MIGIRQADGSFYEILGDQQRGRKRLVLSAARTDQHGVRIELYRSTDGTIDPSGALGSLSLDDAEGLGYQDIEFRVDLDAEGQLEASAALPGQPPRRLSVDLSRFRDSADLGGGNAPAPGLDDISFDDPLLDDLEPMTLDLPEVEEDLVEAPRRADADILADEALALNEFDTLDDSFSLDPPEIDLEPEVDLETPRRSDSDILGDDAFASADLDTLEDFSFDGEETPESRGLDDFAAPPSAAASFDLGDLDAGFGDEPAPADDWEKISLDDMEPMEFLDTGAEISAPKTPKAAPKSPPPPKPAADDPFRMDDDEPLDLGDMDSDLSELPDLGDFDGPSPSSENDFDQDFLPPPALTEPSSWESDDLSFEAPTSSKPVKAAKPAKAPKPTRAPEARGPGDGGLDKLSLILSLASLSLLVLLILVLLFLNMIKAPQPPVIQPEVQLWKGASTALVSSSGNPLPKVFDLAAAEPVLLEAETVLEVPQALRTAQVSLVLEPGETVDEVGRRFGPPARIQGNQLSW